MDKYYNTAFLKQIDEAITDLVWVGKRFTKISLGRKMFIIFEWAHSPIRVYPFLRPCHLATKLTSSLHLLLGQVSFSSSSTMSQQFSSSYVKSKQIEENVRCSFLIHISAKEEYEIQIWSNLLYKNSYKEKSKYCRLIWVLSFEKY